MTEKAKETVKISVGTFLQLGSILAITVLSFALVKAQANENSRNQEKHEVLEREKFDKQEAVNKALEAEIKANKEMLTELRIAQKETIIHYTHIMESIEDLKDEVKDFKDQFEIVD